MNRLALISGVLTLSLYIPLCIQLLVGKVKQNIASWVLWAALDGIAALSILWQHGNWMLPAAYSLGSLIVFLSILRSKSFAWTWFESVVAVLVVACIVVWVLSGPRMATIASTSAVVIAGIPQLLDAVRRPTENPFLVYAGFFIASGIATMAGREWTVEERLYPASTTVLCFFAVIAIGRKFILRSTPED